MLKRFLSTLWIILFSLTLSAQKDNLKYAKRILKTLCSSALEGRGYVNHGDLKSAKFIAHEFQKLKLLPAAGKSYFQNYTISVNSLPDNLFVKIDNRELKPGQDYLMSADAPTLKGQYPLVFFSKKELQNDTLFYIKLQKAQGKFLVFDLDEFDMKNREDRSFLEILETELKLTPNLPIAGVIKLYNDKMMWTPAPLQALRPVIEMQKTAFSKEAKIISLEVNGYYYDYYPTQNVAAYIKGSEFPDSIVMVTAHYDHLGRMGAKTFFPGANDNASGVSMMLNLARYYSKSPPKYTMVFVAFSGEELGLLGSRFYVEHPLFPLNTVKLLFNLDILGTGVDGITVVNGAIYKSYFNRLVNINKRLNLIKDVKPRGEMCKSDHCFFHQQHVPSLYAYTMGGVSFYHDIYDKAETLTMEEFHDLFTLFHTFLDEI